MFAFPLALLGLLGVPVLFVLYRLQNRARRVPVSSLMLWSEPRSPRVGGLRLQRSRKHLLFYLELLVILLLCLAAGSPSLRMQQRKPPLIVVLDDSFSMLAGGEASARRQAARHLELVLREGWAEPIRLILAGQSVRTLGEPVVDVADVLALLSQWRCLAPAARLDEALGLALRLGGRAGRILVLSDRGPTGAEPASGRVEWRGFGQPRPNVAFVNALRSPVEGAERCLLEVESYSDLPQQVTLSLTGAGEPATRLLELEPRKTARLFLDLPDTAAELRAQLKPDTLPLDGEVVLMPAARRPVRVELRMADQKLGAAVQAALEATQRVLAGPGTPDLLVTDAALEGSAAPAGSGTWVLRFDLETQTTAHLGPFVVDRLHPLTRGLTLEGVIWSAGVAQPLPGVPLIAAGEATLLTELQRPGRQREIRIRLRPELSNLLQTPDWPILFWNLVDWRSALAPGLRQTNLRLGTEATLNAEAQASEVELIEPDGSRRPVPVHDGAATVEAEQAGVYRLGGHAFASNALAPGESDLRGAATGRWGSWDGAAQADPATVEWGLAGALIAAALALLTVHGILVAQEARR